MSDFTPDVHLIESMRNTRLGWHDAFAELIDNSFDAGAAQVAIEFSGKSVTIADDGAGATDVMSMVTFGAHKRHQTTSLGQYGIGLKDAWFWCGDTISIQTTRAGHTTSLRVRYPQDIRQESGRWIGPDPTVTDALPHEKGTRIRFDGLRPRTPSQDVFRRLGLTFMPAIESGRQVVFVKNGKRQPIEAYRLPQLIDPVIDTFEVDGRQTAIHIGIVRDGQRVEYPGFLLCYGHRVITTSNIGCGKYSSQRMAGRITLGPGWKLTKNKNDLSAFDESLEASILQRIEWLLKRAEQLAEDIESNALRSELASLINGGLRDLKGKEKRNSPTGEPSGTVRPVHSGRKRTTAAKIHADIAGDVAVAGNGVRRGLQMDWCIDHEHIIGRFDSLSKTVMLNTANGFVASIKAARNMQALYAVAMGLLANHISSQDDAGQMLIKFDSVGFIADWGRLMSSIDFSKATEARNAS